MHCEVFSIMQVSPLCCLAASELPDASIKLVGFPDPLSDRLGWAIMSYFGRNQPHRYLICTTNMVWCHIANIQPEAVEAEPELM